MTVGVQPRLPLFVALVGLAILAACSGGGSATAGSARFDCAGQSGGSDPAVTRAICLESCNLGCSTTGCARTDIAQNEIVILTFSEDIDVNSVNSSSIRFRTPSGDEPVGEFFVNGPRVEFVPTLSISGGQTFYGFTTGETYTMSIIGGENEPNVVRGTSGRPFGLTLTCTLQSTNGIVDLNDASPRAKLTVPTAANIGAAPIDTNIQIEFDELIDATPFISGTLSPVQLFVRRTRPNTAGEFECDPNATSFPLLGTQSLTYDAGRGVSTLSFTPADPLPGNVCVDISITEGVSDLSGRPAQPQTLTFQTEVLPLEESEIVEEFEDASQLDTEQSSATWAGGIATFGLIGGDGRHGAFDLGVASETPFTDAPTTEIYTLDCDNTIIPKANTSTGSAIAVTDGKFFFTSMVVPANVRLRFIGSSPPQITVVGDLEILGVVESSGASLTMLPSQLGTIGQEGGAAGPFGGKGGNGGQRSPGLLAQLGPLSLYDGQDGEPGQVLAGHAYMGSIAATAGKGASMYPTSGLNSDIQFVSGSAVVKYGLSLSAGGSGGGLFTAGEDGRPISITQSGLPIVNESSYFGAISPPGEAMPLFPFPVTPGLQKSSEHFMVGGAGGGGSSSNATGVLNLALKWAPGAGGGGGAGPMALRTGGRLIIGNNGRIEAMGGSAANNTGTGVGPFVAPAGGGAGGVVLLQVQGSVQNGGLIDVRGGSGGAFMRTTQSGVSPGGVTTSRGGDGSPGYIRLEKLDGAMVSDLGATQPVAGAGNVATLTERDDLVGMRSRNYSTELAFGPLYQRYEIYATVDGVPTVYSDDPAVSAIEAGQGQAIRALFQCVDLDLITLEELGKGPWRTGVRTSSTQTGIASDGLNGFRFSLLIDRMFATDVQIDKLVVVFSN